MFFLYEHFLWALLIPFVLFFFSLNPGQNSIKTLFSLSVLNKLTVHKNRPQHTLRYRLFLLAIVFFILSLARPVTDAKVLSDEQGLIPLIIALDVSQSMYAEDIYPNRLSLAKEKIKALISAGINMRIGLILFSKDAYLAYPLSEDLDALEAMIDRLSLSKKLEPHSNIFAAIEGANHMQRAYEKKNILLFSDGGNSNNITQEKTYLQEHNITLHAIAMATETGALVPKTTSQYSKLNPLLKSLALESGGAYQKYSWGNRDIDAVLSQIKMSSSQHRLTVSQFKHYTELFSYPLGLGLFILFFIFSPLLSFMKSLKTTLILFSLSLTFTQTKAQAGILDFLTIKEAKTYYDDQKFLLSAKAYKSLPPSSQRTYNHANALYKAGQYRQALVLYKQALSENSDLNAKIYHNMGNVFFQEKHLKLAKKYYKKSIKISGHSLTKENLKTVNKILENIKKKKRKKPMPLPGLSKGPGHGKENFDEPPSSDYEVQIENLVLSEEEHWMQLLQKRKAPVFLQKLDTKRISENATQAW